MHTIGVKKEDNTKKLAIFQVNRPIQLFILDYNKKHDKYKYWNVKVNYELDVLKSLKKFLKTKCIPSHK